MSTVLEPDYKNKNITLLKDARVDAISLVDVGANNQTFFLFKRGENFIDEFGNLEHIEEGSNNVAKFLPLLKGGNTDLGEDEWKVAYVVVAIPGEVDQQKDVWEANEIRETAHDFLKRGPLINYMHEDMKKVGELTESYLAPQDMHINGKLIKEGSWVIGVEPHPEIKKMIKAGKVTGVSVQGSSKRAELPTDMRVEKTLEGKAVVQDLFKSNDDMNMQRTGEDFKVPAQGEEPSPEGVIAARLNPNEGGAEDQIIPLGAVGPGVMKLQGALGLEETGSYDEETQSAFIEYLRRTGREPKPSLRMLKFVIQDYDEKKALEEQHAAAAAAPPVEAAAPAPAGAPQQPVEKDAEMRGFNPAATGTTGYAPTNMAGGSGAAYGGTYAAQLLGPNVGNTGIQAPLSNIHPDSNEDDLKAVLIQSSLQGNELLNGFMRENLGITDPYQLLYFKVAPSVLWAMVSAFVFGNDPSMSFAPITERGVVTTQPAYTPPELFPTGSGYSVQKAGTHTKETIQGVLDNLDVHISENLRKSGWLDWVTPHAELPDKNGMMLFEHVVVKCPGGQVAVVTSLDQYNGEVNVQWTGPKGEVNTKTYKSEKLTAIEQFEPLKKTAEELMTDKNGFKVEDGAIVKILEDGQVGEVVGFNPAENTVIVETINKEIELVKREVPAAQLEVINSTKNKPGDKAAPSVPDAKASAVAAAETVMGKAGESLGGSKSGQDPRKFGKIRFIVRSFGKWAGGKHRVCVSRLRSEHPEIAKGREDALCAWLKDQYLGTTKWRNEGKMLKTYGRFAEVYKSVVETGELDITDEEVDNVFKMIAADLGVDSEEVMSKLGESDTDFDIYLDELFGPVEGESVPPGVITKFVNIFKSNKSVDEKSKEAEELLKASEYSDDDKEMKLEVALTATSLAIESALRKSDEEVQLREIEETVGGLKNWLNDYVKNGGNVADMTNPEDSEYIAVTWDDDEFIDVDAGYSPMAKRGFFEDSSDKKSEKKCDCTHAGVCRDAEDCDCDCTDRASCTYKGGMKKMDDGQHPVECVCKACKSKKMNKATGGMPGHKPDCSCPLCMRAKKASASEGPALAKRFCTCKTSDNKTSSTNTSPQLQKCETCGMHEGEMQPGKKRRLKTKESNLTEVNMEKAQMPEGLEGPADAAAEGAEGAGDKDWVGKTVIGPDGNKYIVIDQAGDQLTVAAGRKRATFSMDEVELEEAGAEGAAPEGEAPVAKEGDTEDKLRSAIDVLTEILSSTTGEVAHAEATPAPVMKDGNDAGTSLNDVIYFVNGLADQLDEMKDSFASGGDLGAKIEKVGELVKSVDFTERLEAIEASIAELREKAGTSAPVEEVEAVSKRLSAIERQPGNSAQVSASSEKIEKSADRMFRGLF